MSYFAFADGACKGNPGPASIGAVCFAATSEQAVPSLSAFEDGAETVFTVSRMITARGEKTTNNQAEYKALIAALEKIRDQKLSGVTICMDSLLVVEQVHGRYKVKKAELSPLREKAAALLAATGSRLKHVAREKNAIADALANRAFTASVGGGR